MEIKSRDEIIEDIITSIQDKLDFEVDFSDGEALRTIIEAISAELDLQYWQLEQVRDGSFIESAYGDDLNELVKLFGIERKNATGSVGFVKMYRETTAASNYLIPQGTILETLPNNEGLILQFETTKDVTLGIGELEVLVPAKSISTGKINNVIPDSIIIMNDPPQGIEYVTNPEPFIGGEEEETDEDLKERAINSLDALGLGTINALENKIKSIEGVKDCTAVDMARGVGTVDILVLGNIIPLQEELKKELIKIINETKAGGIDAILIEPTPINIDIEAQLTLSSGYILDNVKLNIEKSIKDYIGNMRIGTTLYTTQLERYILNENPYILDINLIKPVSNVSINPQEIININTIILR